MLVGGASGLGCPQLEEQHGPAGEAAEAEMQAQAPLHGCAALRESQDDLGKALGSDHGSLYMYLFSVPP